MAGDDDLLKDDEIQRLLAQAQSARPTPAMSPPKPESPAAAAEKAPSGNLIGMDEIEALLQSAAAQSAPPPVKPAAPKAAAQKPATREPATRSVSRTDQLLSEVEAGLDAVLTEGARPRRSVQSDVKDAKPLTFTEFGNTSARKGQSLSLGALDEVELDLHVELGRAELLIDEVLSLQEGAVVPLDKLAGDPVDIVVNGRLLARGEVLVLNDNFCVRIGEILTPDF